MEQLEENQISVVDATPSVDIGRGGFLVIGAGKMGVAVISDLIGSDTGQLITVMDTNKHSLVKIMQTFDDVECKDGNITANELVGVMRQHKVVIGCTSYTDNVHFSKLAIRAGCHYLDLGGNMNVVKEQKTLHEEAKKADVCIIPNCGLAPGLANVIAAGAAQEFSKLESIKIRVGGLPEYPIPPLNYQLLFSAEGLINEYMGSSEIIREGEWEQAPSLTGLEDCKKFPFTFLSADPRLEAFHTSGGTSWLPYMFKGKIKDLDYKTIRYKGHCEQMNTMFEKYKDRGLLAEALADMIIGKGPDVTLVRISVIGEINSKRTMIEYECIDYAKEFSSMMRMTGYPTSIIAQMVNSEIFYRGVYTPEECVPYTRDLFGKFMEKLEVRGIEFKKSVVQL